MGQTADPCADANFLLWPFCKAIQGINAVVTTVSPSLQQQQAFQAQAATLQPPPAPQPVTTYGVSETVPPTPEQAQAAINASLTQAAQAAQAQNLQTFQQMQPVPGTGGIALSGLLASLMPGGGGGTPSAGLSTTALIAIGLVAGGGILILTSVGGRRRRY